MANLKIGRLELPLEPAEWNIERQPDSQSFTFRGFLIASSKAETNYYRNELLNHHGQMVPVVWDLDEWFNGYYYLMDVRLDSVEVSYMRQGLYVFEVGLFRVGGFSSTELQSLITTGDRVNDFNTVPRPFHAPPVNALAYNAGTQTVLEVTRVTADGNIATFHGIDPTNDPSWSVDPADYYKGGAYIYFQGKLRTGTELPGNDPTDWYMGNGLIEVRPVTYQGSSNGRWEIRAFNGATWSNWKAFRLTWAGAMGDPSSISPLPSWHYMTVVRNTAEACVVRLVRDAATIPASAHRHTMDFLLRRGSPYLECIYTYSGAAARFSVGPDSATNATRPSTEASYIYGSTLFDGHRWFLGATYNFTLNDSTVIPTGHMRMDANNRIMPFALGFSINDLSSSTTESVVGLVRSYAGPVAETVRAVRR